MVEIEKELFATIALIRDITGKKSVYFRPPEGQLGANGVNVARNFGLQPVYWTADCSRYEGTTPDTMVKYILSSATPGGIIRMHNGEDLSMAELTAVLKALKEKEYRFVTISEMFSGR